MKNKHFKINLTINVIIASILIVVALISLNSSYVIPVSGNVAIYHGNTDRAEVSLMFNVYWGTEYVEPILRVLEKYSVRTTFFIGGTWASKNTDTLKLIATSGHEIGNHGYFHKDAEKLTYSQNKDEITLTNKLIKEVLSVDVTLFAPPSGSIGSEMFKACDDLNMTVIMWSRDTIDWRDKDSSLVLKRATQDIQNGDFVLMHPTEHTLKALPVILDTLQSKGLCVKTVSECLALEQV